MLCVQLRNRAERRGLGCLGDVDLAVSPGSGVIQDVSFNIVPKLGVEMGFKRPRLSALID